MLISYLLRNFDYCFCLFSSSIVFVPYCICSLPMDSESVVAAEGADCAIANGGVTMEGDSSNGTLENSAGCSTQHPVEACEVGD